MNGKWEKTSDGIKFYGSGYRTGGAIVANPVENFSDASIYVKWMAHGGDGNYMGISPAVGVVNSSDWIDWGVIPNYTTNHSWNGSNVLPQDIWLYTRIDIHPDLTWKYFTATGNYDNQGGSTLYTSSYSAAMMGESDLLWHDRVENGMLSIGLGDNYGGTSAWGLVAEAKYAIAPGAVPEPVTLLIFGTGILGLAGIRIREKRK